MAEKGERRVVMKSKNKFKAEIHKPTNNYHHSA